MRLVISQPMFFPWVGMLEQMRLADCWVHYDDVQFSKGSFSNRVQIKTDQGSRWLTLPLSGLRLGDPIDQVRVDNRGDFKARHLAQLAEAYREAPHAQDMLAMVNRVYGEPTDRLDELACRSMGELASYFDLPFERAITSSALGIGGCGSARVLAICQALGATEYVTGHGAKNYLDHEAFERAGIAVSYMAYEMQGYPQLHGAFTPYVSALDLVANAGPDGRRSIRSTTVSWKEVLAA